MATILIPTIQNDIHATAVALVLEQMGHRPIRWFCQDLPEAATASFRVGTQAGRVILRPTAEAGIAPQNVDIFWNRRVGDPIIKNPDAQPSDQKVARQEMKQFVRGLVQTLSERAFAVNDHEAARRANKLYQLHVATQLGFHIPETLISNDPEHIKAFLRQHEDAGVIFKGFRPVTWVAGKRTAQLYTHEVRLGMLPYDPMLQLSPGIFQTQVPKAFEVRVTCMGAELFAAKLDSQSSQAGRVDWRQEVPSAMPTSRMELPGKIADRCRSLLKRLGLVFGCLDFIVTPSGEYVFLEVNQMGQFLWVEEVAPELPLLQAFCEFLVSRDRTFASPARSNSVSPSATSSKRLMPWSWRTGPGTSSPTSTSRWCTKSRRTAPGHPRDHRPDATVVGLERASAVQLTRVTVNFP